MQNIPISKARNQMTSPPETLTAESGAGLPLHDEESLYWLLCHGNDMNPSSKP